MFGMFRFEALPVRLGRCLDINIYKSMPQISPEKQTDKNTATVFVTMCLINQHAIFGNTPYGDSDDEDSRLDSVSEDDL